MSDCRPSDSIPSWTTAARMRAESTGRSRCSRTPSRSRARRRASRPWSAAQVSGSTFPRGTSRRQKNRTFVEQAINKIIAADAKAVRRGGIRASGSASQRHVSRICYLPLYWIDCLQSVAVGPPRPSRGGKPYSDGTSTYDIWLSFGIQSDPASPLALRRFARTKLSRHSNCNRIPREHL